MIKIRVRPSHGGKFEWRSEGAAVTAWGVSEQPLFDGCRELQRLGVDAAAECGLFHEGRADWSLKTTVGKGAALTVSDPPSGKGGVKIVPYRPFPDHRKTH